MLAFDAAANLEFDAIVLPRTSPDTHYSTDEFVQDVTNVVEFNVSIIYTVDHDSAAHVFGKTVRSSKEGSDGYVVDDLVAAIESAAKKSNLASEKSELAVRPSCSGLSLPKSTKRLRWDCADSTRDPASEQPPRPSKHTRYEGQDRRHYPCSADEIAYLQYGAYVQYGQMLARAQSPEGGHYPHAPSAAITESSAATINTTSSISMPTPAAHAFSVHNTIPHHPRPYSHHHNSPSHRDQPCHLFSFYHTSHYPYLYPYATTLHPPSASAQSYYAHPRCSNPSVLQHHQEAVVPVAHETHLQHQQQRPASQGDCASDNIAEAREEHFLASASVPVVSDDILDDYLGHGRHPNVPSFTRAVELPSADNSSDDSCTTRESLDSLSLDDTAVVEIGDFRESFGTDSIDPIDGAEFAACFDVDTWI